MCVDVCRDVNVGVLYRVCVVYVVYVVFCVLCLVVFEILCFGL